MNEFWPRRFDSNEWFVLISLIIVYGVFLALPRRFPRVVALAYCSIGFGISMYWDFHLGIPPADLYDINDSPNYEITDMFLFVLYPPFAYFFVYFMDLWKIRGLGVALYVLACSAGGMAFEALAVYYRVFTYKHWTLGLSFLFYLFAQTVLAFLYLLIERNYGRKKMESG
ncbi:hypothetical protein H7B90_26035 [Cohnella xylanilytica]|uniref:Uncharacterized protein n=1 Tax=Cohnella xylanilytica TaxID=557555 RepID=A0A841U5H4_9BACL|nr:hypothetical protein [Cohnella xylanilytica]MBB6694862.1 hypothetical protein [Cohnella xylanilytica]